MHMTKHLSLSLMIDYYHVLSLPRNASFAEIKARYHQLLLKHHPDKNVNIAILKQELLDVALLNEAFATLASPLSRSEYDASLRQETNGHTPRPAQVISLEDFTQLDLEGKDDIWQFPCRCGGTYQICDEEMEKGQHMVGCNNCSEVVWVGYEVQESDGGRN